MAKDDATLTRRDWLIGAAAAPAALGVAAPAARANEETLALPAKPAFAQMPFTYLDSGSTHPTPLGAKAAVEAYMARKTRDRAAPEEVENEESSATVFARLINADPDEISYVFSTTMGENLSLLAAGMPQAGGRIVTDALHFFGSHYTYGEMRRAGMDIVTLPMTEDGRISMDDMAAAVNAKTKFVAVSSVSTINGFQHDLKKVCEIAHAHGALVYADIIHGAGSVPFDVKESGVDFAACSTYKWLMGDMGRGFLYIRKDLQDRVRRPWWGYHQIASFQTHLYPFDPPGEHPADYTARADAEGLFSMGTEAYGVEAHLRYSLPWIEKLGVARIQAWRQPMIDAVQTELRRRGYQPMTPLDSKTPMVAFAVKDARSRLGELLRDANIRMTVSANRFRVSVSVFNDMNDIDRLLEALPKQPD
jgi:selenocysteine lyase/cysteine desulfurase